MSVAPALSFLMPQSHQHLELGTAAHLNHPCLNSRESENHFLRGMNNLPRASVITGGLSVLGTEAQKLLNSMRKVVRTGVLAPFPHAQLHTDHTAQSEGGTECYESVLMVCDSRLETSTVK